MKATKIVNVAAVKHRSLFRYPGGKTWFVPRMRQWLSSLSFRPAELVEPFAGGAIVGLSALFDDLVDRITLVEKDENIAAVWQIVFAGHSKQLARRIRDFEVTEQNVRTTLAAEGRTTLDRAFATIVRNRMQRGGIMSPGATLMKSGEDGKGLMSRWYANTLRRRIADLHAIRERVNFIEGDGIEQMRTLAPRPDIVAFVDPPYTVAGRRLYVHSTIDHEDLFRVAASMKGEVLMTYDSVESIRRLAARVDFKTRLIAMKNTHHAIQAELVVGRDLAWLD